MLEVCDLGTASCPHSNWADTTSLLSESSEFRSRIIAQHCDLMQDIENAVSSMPNSEDVSSEGNRLRKTFNRGAHTTLVKRAEEVSFREHLESICWTLESSENGQDSLAALQAETLVDNGGPKSDSESIVDVKAELGKAWALDQAEILAAKGRVLDSVRRKVVNVSNFTYHLSQTILAFRTTVMPPLLASHGNLSDTESQIREAEALVIALGEEIEDVVDDVQTAKQYHEMGPSNPTEELTNAQLQAELTALLNRTESTTESTLQSLRY